MRKNPTELKKKKNARAGKRPKSTFFFSAAKILYEDYQHTLF